MINRCRIALDYKNKQTHVFLQLPLLSSLSLLSLFSLFQIILSIEFNIGSAPKVKGIKSVLIWFSTLIV